MSNPVIHTITQGSGTITLTGTGVSYTFPFDGPAFTTTTTAALEAGFAQIAKAISDNGATLAATLKTISATASTPAASVVAAVL